MSKEHTDEFVRVFEKNTEHILDNLSRVFVTLGWLPPRVDKSDSRIKDIVQICRKKKARTAGGPKMVKDGRIIREEKNA